MWNILYDGLLREELPSEVQFLAYADDVAIIAMDKDTIELSPMVIEAAKIAKVWIALHKSELMVIIKTRKYNYVVVDIEGTIYSNL